jgi:pyruvyltransferase
MHSNTLFKSVTLEKTYKRWRRRLTPTIDLFYSSRNLLLKRMRSKVIIVFWYQEKNFGDLLTPDILRFYGVEPLLTPNFDHCEVVSVGSILEIVPESYKGVILGSGFISNSTEKQFKFATILLVRGRLTANKLSLPDSIPMGDPGILVSQVYQRQLLGVTKKYLLGIIPHYKHLNEAAIQKIKERYSKDVCVIDVRRKPSEVIRDIAACQNIASSSLHGIIVSHSLGIPVFPLELDIALRGGKFKFFDYYSVYNVEPTFHKLRGDESLDELCGLATPLDAQLVASVRENVNAAFTRYINTLSL